MAKQQTIRILVAIFLIKIAGCQDGFSDQDFLRLQQQYSINDGQSETITGYSTNVMQREPNSQSMNSVNLHYHLAGDSNGDYNRIDRGRSRKVYRIKNPFQQQQEDDKSSQEIQDSQDSATGSSNQYPAMQYSLPPEEFLQKMRAENQYHQQQQLTTQVSASPYTATPQPQYQYSTIPASNYDQQSNQLSTTEPKVYSPTYQSNSNSYQYNPFVYNVEPTQSTQVPPYLTTPLPNPQYIDTPTNTYVSSSSPIYLSSPQNVQQYVSSPMSNIQSGTVDYSNNRVTTAGSKYEINNEYGKAMQIDLFDNSVNGLRYPLHPQSQYQNDFPSSTMSPNTSIYPEHLHSNWQTPVSSALNALPKSEMYAQKPYQNYRYNSNQRDNRQETNSDLSNTDSNRFGSIAAANNLFLNYAQPDYHVYNNIKSQARDSEQDMSQSDVYSHGDYGWKLSEKKSSLEPEISTKNNYFQYQFHSLQPETGAISQVNFQMDSSKAYGLEQNTKPVTEKLEAEEFAKAAAKAHEKYKQQLEANKYMSNAHYNNNLMQNSYNLNSHYNNDNDNDKQRNKQYSNSVSSHGNINSEVVTSTPFLYMNNREVLENRHKIPFDHNKALKNIVPIDVSNVVQNSDSSVKIPTDADSSNRYSNLEYYNEPSEQTHKQFLKQVNDPYYQDKNTMYTIKSKPDDLLEKMKQFEQNYGKHQTSDIGLNSGNKRFVDELTQSLKFANQIVSNHYDNTQSLANTHQQGLQRPQTSSDLNNLLKFNDIPYRLTQSYNSETQRNRNSNGLEHGNIPTPLPSRFNQNVENHHIDITSEILNKLMANKQHNPNVNRPEVDIQSGNLISTINGFKVANPFNVDLKLVADMLKGKPSFDESQMTPLRNELNKNLPIKFDITQLQQLLQYQNDNNVMTLNNGVINPFSNSFYDIYNNGRYPYQGVKYSRSEEAPETIPIADSSNHHPIGAVVEEDEVNTDVSDITDPTEEFNLDDDKHKSAFNSSQRSLNERHKRPSASTNRYSYKRKYPKSEFEEPYPLLKPPPPHSSRHRTVYKGDKSIHRRRVIRPKMLRVYKTQPLFEGDSSMDDDIGSLRRSFSVAEEKSDIVEEKTE
ncbi:unnamed protein product, partial [Brenthis ino]